MMNEFGKDYWEDQWGPTGSGRKRRLPVNPYLRAETAHLPVGAVLDAGCGTGTEALWLAEQGWDVTAADISATALAEARARAAGGVGEHIDWVETDLSRWEPARSWDLVFTSYAHAQIGQLPLYRRIASWVAPGGTLLIVGHLHGDHHDVPRGHDHPQGATATLEGITNLFSSPEWRIDSAYEHTRTVHPGGSPVHLRDVIVRVHRLP
ncbi:methyltransferase domain-containing protein [Microbacterium sp. CFH 90308]|uniref:Methyltransferase domain-containing protein n=1 Tax=Microbacterium salsuginis TaxID=2722803 RepID=A0ABX1K825_9MICO|nr:class I SAM-dependent methyltransferase [Microbacterium sp. CFH 90308]NLP83142.1 methyltransferase domain-containing protein [Microbacterium sp. CFH 90308]